METRGEDEERQRQEEQSREEARGKKVLQSGLRYLHIAFILPGATLVGWGIGAWLDTKLGTKWLYLLGLGLGIVAGFYDLIRSVARMNRELERDSK